MYKTLDTSYLLWYNYIIKERKCVCMTETKKFKPSTKIKLDNVGEYYQDLNRGVGVIKPKKGKGSFQRKPKHRKVEW